MARIVFLMLPEPGHLLPTFRIAAALFERGHEVHYLTLPEFRIDCETQGFRFNRMRSMTCDINGIGSLYETLRAGSALYRSVVPRLCAEGKTILGEEREEIASIRPDLLVVDTGVMVIDSVVVGHRRSPLERLDPLKGLGCGLLQMSPCFTEHYGDSPLATLGPGCPEVILCPQELDLPTAHPAVGRQFFAEPSVSERRPYVPFPWEWIDRNKRLIYCTFGTQSTNYDAAYGALKIATQAFADNSEFQLVIAAGGHVDEDIFGTLPKNVLFRKSVPQIEVLRHTTVLITHGGLGTLKEAILSAVPMIVIPFAFDQPYNARRVTYHGLGRTFLPNSLTRENLVTAARELADDESTRIRLRTFQKIFTKAECRAPSIAVIERLLASINSADCAMT